MTLKTRIITNTKNQLKGANMGKHSLKIIIFLVLVAIVLSACCQNPPPPIKKSQIDELRISVEKLETTLNSQTTRINSLEKKLDKKEAELQALKDYEQQLIKEGYLKEE